MQDYYWLNEDSRTFLAKDYLVEGQSPEERYREIAEAAESYLGIQGFADKFESYLKKGWFSLSSPVIANFGNKRGLPISCNGSYVSDTMAGILGTAAEIGIMTKHGAGTSAFFGAVRHRGADISIGGKSSGTVHFMGLFDSLIDTISQSNIRRGSLAVYLPIEHPDVNEFLKIREEGFHIQHLFLGLCIGNEWMESMIAGDKDKRTLWGRIIKKRFETGLPYIFFTDNVNDGAPQVYKDKGVKIHASNLCSEIALASNENESFVCNLSSMNILHWDEWKDTDAVQVLTYFLDAVMTEYIEKVKGIEFMEKAYNFAVNQRALGIGTLGWHSYLQSQMIAFESMQAKILNVRIHKFIRDKSQEASRELAEMYGEPEMLKGYGLRNVTTMAIAPTTSSSFILGQVSPSIEPLNSNYFTKDLAKGKFSYKNPYLKNLLATYKKDDSDTWLSILHKGGSVQHLDFLTEDEKDVFKTFGEISQKEIIIQAAARQKYIDQAQSINLTIDGTSSPKDVSSLLIFAWEQGVKTLYYQRSANQAQKLNRDLLECKSCEA